MDVSETMTHNNSIKAILYRILISHCLRGAKCTRHK